MHNFDKCRNQEKNPIFILDFWDANNISLCHGVIYSLLYAIYTTNLYLFVLHYLYLAINFMFYKKLVPTFVLFLTKKMKNVEFIFLKMVPK